jgi:hypothetical protein
MRIAQKLLSLVSSKDNANRSEAPAGTTTLTPAKPGGRLRRLKAAVIGSGRSATWNATKPEPHDVKSGSTIGLARGLAHQHGAAIASASMPPANASGQLRTRYTEEWSDNAAKLSQLNAKHAKSLESVAGSLAGFEILNEASARHPNQQLKGADMQAVFALGKQLAVAKAASDLCAEAKPESMETNARARLVDGNDAALRIRQTLVDARLSPAEAQGRMLQAAEQMKAGKTPDWSQIIPVGKAQMADATIPVERAVVETMPELQQVNTQHAVRVDPHAAIADWQALDEHWAGGGANAANLPDQDMTAALGHLDEALAGLATDASSPIDND